METNSPETTASEQLAQGPKNKFPKWVTMLLVWGGALAIIVAAILGGNAVYYQVSPLAGFSVVKSSSQEPDINAFLEALRNSKLEDPSTQCVNYRTNAVNPECKEVLDLIAKQGLSVLKNVSLIHSYGTGLGNGYVAAAFVAVGDQENMVNFRVYPPEPKSLGPNRFDVVSVKKIDGLAKITNATADLTMIDTVPIKILTLQGESASGEKVTKYFAADGDKDSARTYFDVEKNVDGTFSARITSSESSGGDPVVISMLVPISMENSSLYSPRDQFIEESNKVSPIYHTAECTLEDSYADFLFDGYFGNSDLNASLELEINDGTHKTLYTTTPFSGYVPEQWGKITGKLSIDDFIAQVQKPTAINSNSPVEMFQLAGYTIKHIGPIAPTRTCKEATYDQYQTVKNGAVITLQVDHSRGKSSPEIEEKTKAFLAQVLQSLTITPK